MTITDVLKSEKLTKNGALRLLESLLDGETQVDVNNGEVLICYGQYPQSYATYEMVTGGGINEFIEGLNEGTGEEPYDNMKLFLEVLGTNNISETDDVVKTMENTLDPVNKLIPLLKEKG